MKDLVLGDWPALCYLFRDNAEDWSGSFTMAICLISHQPVYKLAPIFLLLFISGIWARFWPMGVMLMFLYMVLFCTCNRSFQKGLKSFCSGVLSIPSSPDCINTRGCPHPSAGPCTWSHWTSWSSHGRTSRTCPSLSRWHPIPQMCQLHHSALCHLQTDAIIPYPPTSPPIKSISLQFREKNVGGDCVKGFTEGQTDHIHSPSFVHWCSDSIIEGH